MTNRTIIRLAQIAHEYDLVGMPREADIIESAMMRLADGSAVGNWWNGIQDVGRGIAQDAKAAGEIIAAPFGAAAAGASAAWNSGIKNVPAAWGQAADQAYSRVRDDTTQELHDYAQGVPAALGPGGTGLPGAAVEDAARNVGQAFQGTAQGYLSNALDQREQVKQQANIASWLQQAVQRHKQDGHGWDVINSAIQYGGLSAENQAKLRQEFQAKAAQYSSNQPRPH